MGNAWRRGTGAIGRAGPDACKDNKNRTNRLLRRRISWTQVGTYERRSAIPSGR